VVNPAPPVPVLNGTAAVMVAPNGQEAFSSLGTTDASAPIMSWGLNYGDGSPDAGGSGPPPSVLPGHDYAIAGEYAARLSVTDALGDRGTDTFTVNIEIRPTVTSALPRPGPVVVSVPAGFMPGETVDSLGTVQANSTGGFTTTVRLSNALPAGTYRLTITGALSGASAVTDVALYTNVLEFGDDPAHGDRNASEWLINPTNVGSLQAAPWHGYTGGAISAAPAVDQMLVMVGSADKSLHIFDAAAAVAHEPVRTGGAVDATPVISGSTLFTPSTDGNIYATSLACHGANFGIICGPTVFADLGTPIESSPVVVNGVMYVGADNGRLYAIDATTGAVRWTLSTGGKVVSSPAVSGGLVVFGSDDGKVYGVDATTGAANFSFSTGGPVTSSPAIDPATKTVFVGSQDGHLYAIPLGCAGACAPKWNLATNGPVESSPAISNGTVFIGSDDGHLYAVTESTGKTAWSVTTGGPVKSPPSVANGVLYFGSDDGRVYAVASTGCGQTNCSPLWSALTGGAVVAEPVVADGSLFVGSGDGLLHVYQLPKG